MIITKMALPRRSFLRGMGATLALPFLDAMVPALSAAAPGGNRVTRLASSTRPTARICPTSTPPPPGKATR